MHFDVIVVGGGHAGCEAALCSSRMGLSTLLLTINLDTIGQMSCNPSIGGLGKSQIVYEIDALGGEIGFNTDKTGISFRMLNKKKGPAVWSLRAQVSRKDYRNELRRAIERGNISIKQALVTDILVHKNTAIGVRTQTGMEYYGKTVIITTGTFLNGLIHIGLKNFQAGRMGEPPASELSKSLTSLGFKLGRLKTGTSPRIDKRTVDFKYLTPQYPDENPENFSYKTKNFTPPKVPCFITRTNKKTHEIISKNLNRSPLFQKVIKGTGVRYCPSIEDKVVKFEGRDSHQVFLEPDGVDTYEYYLNGLATSLPLDVQIDFLHTIKGLKSVEIIRPGYAIEYDFVYPTQNFPTLETKLVKNLFLAGQINGTSGYEEAAGQGIIAGINASLKVKEEKPFILSRSEAYIGVLIDDLVTKGTEEPYRMFTSRAEHRLILRQDNARERLMEYGVRFGLVDEGEYKKTVKLQNKVKNTILMFKTTSMKPSLINPILKNAGSEEIKNSTNLFQVLKRPEVDYEALSEFVGDIEKDVIKKVEIHAKYDGYIEREEKLVKKMRELEQRKIPENIDYYKIKALSNETKEKLSKIRPLTLGQASRIPGIRPPDITILHIYISSLIRVNSYVNRGSAH